MIPVVTEELKPAALSGLEPGQLVLNRSGDGSALGIVLAPHYNERPLLMLPSCDLWSPGKGKDQKVFPLGISAIDLVVRIDFGSSATNFAEHRQGQLILSDDGLCVAVQWPNLREKHYRNVVLLSNWTVSAEEAPRHLFDRWALSMRNVGSAFVDIFKKDGET